MILVWMVRETEIPSGWRKPGTAEAEFLGEYDNSSGKSSQLTVIGFKIIEFITVMVLVQKCKQRKRKKASLETWAELLD